MSDEFWGWFDTINHLEISTNLLVSNRWSMRHRRVRGEDFPLDDLIF
jgi:hypothetical protein